MGVGDGEEGRRSREGGGGEWAGGIEARMESLQSRDVHTKEFAAKIESLKSFDNVAKEFEAIVESIRSLENVAKQLEARMEYLEDLAGVLDRQTATVGDPRDGVAYSHR